MIISIVFGETFCFNIRELTIGKTSKQTVSLKVIDLIYYFLFKKDTLELYYYMLSFCSIMKVV